MGSSWKQRVNGGASVIRAGSFCIFYYAARWSMAATNFDTAPSFGKPAGPFEKRGRHNAVPLGTPRDVRREGQR